MPLFFLMSFERIIVSLWNHLECITFSLPKLLPNEREVRDGRKRTINQHSSLLNCNIYPNEKFPVVNNLLTHSIRWLIYEIEQGNVMCTEEFLSLWYHSENIANLGMNILILFYLQNSYVTFRWNFSIIPKKLQICPFLKELRKEKSKISDG